MYRIDQLEKEWLRNLWSPAPHIKSEDDLAFDHSPFLFKEDEARFQRIIEAHGASGADIVATLFPLKLAYPHLVFDQDYTERHHNAYFKNRFGISSPLAEDFDPEEPRDEQGRWTESTEEHLVSESAQKGKTPKPWLTKNGDLIGQPGDTSKRKHIRVIEAEDPEKAAKAFFEQGRQHLLENGYLSKGKILRETKGKTFPSEDFEKDNHIVTLNYRDDDASSEATPDGEKTVDIHHDPEVKEKHGFKALKFKFRTILRNTPNLSRETIPSNKVNSISGSKSFQEDLSVIPEGGRESMLPETMESKIPEIEIPEIFLP